jgi:hypothetical protein
VKSTQNAARIRVAEKNADWALCEKVRTSDMEGRLERASRQARQPLLRCDADAYRSQTSTERPRAGCGCEVMEQARMLPRPGRQEAMAAVKAATENEGKHWFKAAARIRVAEDYAD